MNACVCLPLFVLSNPVAFSFSFCFTKSRCIVVPIHGLTSEIHFSQTGNAIFLAVSFSTRATTKQTVIEWGTMVVQD
ncbi:hypothetical protein F5Y17DRAFT_434995 [Xylariaceae sp. FL0594]|nr:hypothetical protein F5Y17DRAFT_434995 [Xylariaceae sp. FL0594]